MISFDDLVNSGGDTEQLENEMREIRLNTQVNRFSIIDCTNSIESLSSMMSTITVADYSASLSSLSSDTLALYNSLTTITVADYSASLSSLSSDTYLLNSSMSDVISSISSLSSNTLALYNSIITITGGGGSGGFGYLEPYSAHSTGNFIYNCNDILSNQSFNETFKEVGPNLNFDGVSFTSDQKLNLKGQTLNNCLIQYITEPVMLDYKLIQNGNYNNNQLLSIVNNTEFKNNVISYSSGRYNNIYLIGLSNTGNVYSAMDKLFISASMYAENTQHNIKYGEIKARSISSNMFISFNVNISCDYCVGNTLTSASQNNVKVIYNKSNSIKSMWNYNILNYYGNSNTFENITCFNGIQNGNYKGFYNTINNLNIIGNGLGEYKFDSINLNNLKYNSISKNTFTSNRLINLTGYSMTGNNFNSNTVINISGILLSNNTFDYGRLNVICDTFSQAYIKDVNKFKLNCNSLYWLSYNYSITDYLSTASKAKYINIDCNNALACNIGNAERLKFKGDEINGCNFKGIDNVVISVNNISNIRVEDAKDLDLWFDSMPLDKEYSADYYLSNISTLHIHKMSSYTDNWDALYNRPIAAFSNGVKCLDFDFMVPTYLINPGNSGIWNGAGYGYVGFHVSDIYVNGVPFSCYNH